MPACSNRQVQNLVVGLLKRRYVICNFYFADSRGDVRFRFVEPCREGAIMLKSLWCGTIVALVGATILLTPATSQAQRYWGGMRGVRGGGYSGGYYSDGYYRDGGYYRAGWGWRSDNSVTSFYPDAETLATSFYPSMDGLANPNDAGFVIRVPDPNAEILFGDHKTLQRGFLRRYETERPLDPNSTYTFNVRARWTQNGQTMEQTRKIEARAGQNLMVDFTSPQREPVPNAPAKTQPNRLPNNNPANNPTGTQQPNTQQPNNPQPTSPNNQRPNNSPNNGTPRNQQGEPTNPPAQPPTGEPR
jgi:uncharacterized protein (TIGR03000 family)